MPPFKPIKRKDLIKGELRLILPNPHQSEISKDLLARILHQANLTREKWEKTLMAKLRVLAHRVLCKELGVFLLDAIIPGMSKYIACLRAINEGGHNVKMDHLRVAVFLDLHGNKCDLLQLNS